MRCCEAQQNVEYVLAYASNEQLRGFTWGLEQQLSKAAYEQQRQQIAARHPGTFS